MPVLAAEHPATQFTLQRVNERNRDFSTNTGSSRYSIGRDTTCHEEGSDIGGRLFPAGFCGVDNRAKHRQNGPNRSPSGVRYEIPTTFVHRDRGIRLATKL